MIVKGTDGAVEFDGLWVTVRRRGVFALVVAGRRWEVRLHVDQIIGLDLEPPGLLSPGRFTIVAPNIAVDLDGRGDPLAVTFQVWHIEEFRDLRDRLQEAVTRRRSPASGPGVEQWIPRPRHDLVSQLSLLADMHSTGELTDREYAAAKAALLA